ncbi:MAG: MBL fold metallo-hydrolase [Chloroflexota bacterium]|nr:MBL fold metallo-hydrolase [Chloroflexota bacterium]
MPAEKLQVGNVQVLALWESDLTSGGPEFWAWLPPGAREKYPEILSPGVVLHHNVCSYLVVSEGKRVLVDTGVGPGPFPNPQDGTTRKGRLLEALKELGLSAGDIDYVFITHLHGDHIGWNVTRSGSQWVPTFPKAKYLLPKADWVHFRTPEAQAKHAYVKDFLLPMETMLDHVTLTEGEFKLNSELRAYPTPGHTPGHQSLLVSSSGQRALVVGDVVHVRAQLQETDWISNADSLGELGVKTRKRVVEWLAKEGVPAAVIHFPHPGFGKVVVGQGRRYWQAL